MLQPTNYISRYQQHKSCCASVLWRQPKGLTRAQLCASRPSLSHAGRAAPVGAALRRGNNGDQLQCTVPQDRSWCRQAPRAAVAAAEERELGGEFTALL
eukprot:1805930-Pleurochrysis_carterae.AAC.1